MLPVHVHTGYRFSLHWRLRLRNQQLQQQQQWNNNGAVYDGVAMEKWGGNVLFPHEWNPLCEESLCGVPRKILHRKTQWCCLKCPKRQQGIQQLLYITIKNNGNNQQDPINQYMPEKKPQWWAIFIKKHSLIKNIHS